jgi:hypothetical protein
MKSHLLVMLTVLILTPFVYAKRYMPVDSVSHDCSMEQEESGATVAKCKYKVRGRDGKVYSTNEGDSMNMVGVKADYLDVLIYSHGMGGAKNLILPSEKNEALTYEDIRTQINRALSKDRCRFLKAAYSSITEDYKSKETKLIDASNKAQCGGITTNTPSTRSQRSTGRRGTR